MVLTSFQRRLRVVIKRFIYSQLYLREALFILFGKSRPQVRFTVEASPPSLYLNFAIRPEQLEAFERDLALPHPLAPIRCLESEAEYHCLTLNVYRVSGLANGLRAEWSTYVLDASGKPRYMIVEARTDRGSMDPIDIVTRAGHVVYEDGADAWTFEVGSDLEKCFRARCEKSALGDLVRGAPEWIEANDYIYWRNGVCDRTFYDSGLANPRTRSIDVAGVKIEDDTRWSAFIDPTPKSVIVWENAIEFSMSPWWNIDEL